MKAGDLVETPRFLKVRIRAMYAKVETLREDGYTEPTHYRDPDYFILGKNIGGNCMVFAAAPRYGEDEK